MFFPSRFSNSLVSSWIKEENEQLCALLPCFLGQYFVQFGYEPLPNLEICPILHKVLMTDKKTKLASSIPVVYGNYSELPFADNSLDLILLPHIVEFSSQPVTVLQEAWRALAGNAYLIILGFNPWNFLGLYRFVCRNRLPYWNRNFYTDQTICRWIRSLGGRITVHVKFFPYPLTCSSYRSAKFKWIERLSDGASAYLGGIYLIVAKKKIQMPLSVLPVSSVWVPKKESKSGVAA